MTPRAAKPALGLTDVISLGVGIIIGVGIFRLPKDVFGSVPDAATGMGLWVLGGLLAAAGALCYAELASAYAHSSGEYVYLRRAYGPFVGFGFAWAMLTVIRTGASIAPIAYVFAEYAQKLHDFGPQSKLIYVTAAIGGLTVINALGIHPGRRTQNTLTLAKVLGLAGVIVAGFYLYLRPSAELLIEPPADIRPSFTMAMIAVLWAYSGWHEVAYVVADLRDFKKNFARAILLGVAAVAVVYLAFNAALLAGLGLNAVRTEEALGTVVAERAIGRPGEVAIAVLLAGGARFVLRVKEPDRPRPVRVPALPVVGVVFCTCCVFMLYQSTDYAARQRPAEAIVVGALLLLGLPVYVLGRRGHFEQGR